MKTNHELIKQRRKELGLKQKDLAERTGHTSAMVCYIEQGRFQLTQKFSPLYARVLNVRESELFVFEN